VAVPVRFRCGPSGGRVATMRDALRMSARTCARTAVRITILALAGVSCGGSDAAPRASTGPSPAAETPEVPAPDPATDPALDPAGDAANGVAIGRATAQPGTLTVAATGDVLPHSPLWRQAANDAGGDGYDFAPMFAEIEPTLAAADLAICHLETPIAPEGEEYSTSPLYGVPPQIADAISSAGFDRCSTASNHAFDRGVAGIDRTVEVLLAAGVEQSGMARTEPESHPAPFTVNGITVSHLSFTYGHNGNYVPPGEDWRAPLIEADRVVAEARSAREQGADVVLVSLHWGTEGESEPTAEQRAIADTVTASGAVDLIIGHHTHVLQPIEQVNGVWVAFGLGNILSNLPVSDRWPASSQDAAIVEFPIVVSGTPGDRRVEVGTPSARPTWVDKNNGWVIRDVLLELDDPATPDSRRAALTASLDRTRSVIGPYVVHDAGAS